MKISRFATDLNLEENGVWVDLGDGGQLLIARMSNPAYRDRIRILTKPYKRQIRNDSLEEGILDDLIIKAMSETVLLDWKGIEDDKGKPIKYSTKNAYELLRDLRDFRVLVSELSTEQELFRRAETEAEGNS